MNIKKLFTDAVALFDLDKSPAEKGNKRLSNNDIISLLKASFLNTVEMESITDRRMMYDVSFLILMHPQDYADRELALPILTQEAVNIFYETIDENKANYKNFIPIGNNWFFQYSPSEKFGDIEISLGEPMILGTLVALKNSWGNISGKQLRVSKIANNSKYDRFDINPEVFKNLDVFARGVFRIKINSDLMQLSKPPKSEGESYASISYIKDGQEFTYSMTETEIIITLKNELTPNATNILAIDVLGLGLKINHIRVKYDETQNIFSIITNENDVVINEKKIPIAPHIEPLPDQASIMLGWFNLKFKRTI